MALLATVLAISAPSLSRFFRGRTLDSEAHRFLALTRHAQQRAVSEGVPMVLWFDTEQRTYGLNADTSFVEEDAQAEEFSVDEGLEIEVLLSPEAVLAGEASLYKNEKLTTDGLHTMRFNPDGFASLSSPETVVFRQGEDAEIRVTQRRNRLSYEIQTGNPTNARR